MRPHFHRRYRDDDLCFTALFRKTEIYMIPVDKIQIYRIIKKT